MSFFESVVTCNVIKIAWLASVDNFSGTLRYRCVKSVQIRSFSGPYFAVFGPKTGKYGPEKTLYLDIFHAVYFILSASYVAMCLKSKTFLYTTQKPFSSKTKYPEAV